MPLDSSQIKEAQNSPHERAAESKPESISIALADHAAWQRLVQNTLSELPTSSSRIAQSKSQSDSQPLQQAKLFGEGIVSGLALNPVNGLTQFANESIGTNFKAIHLGAQSEIDSSIAGNVGKVIGTTAIFIGLALATKKVTPLGSNMLGSAALSESVAFGTAGAIQGGLLTPTQKDLSGSSFFLSRGGEALLGSGSAVLGAQGSRVAKLFQASAPSLGVTGSRLLSVGAEGVFNGALGAGTAHAYSYMKTGKWASNQEVANSAILSAGIGLGASALSFGKGARENHTARSESVLANRTPTGDAQIRSYVEKLKPEMREAYLDRHLAPNTAFVSPYPVDEHFIPEGARSRTQEISPPRESHIIRENNPYGRGLEEQTVPTREDTAFLRELVTAPVDLILPRTARNFLITKAIQSSPFEWYDSTHRGDRSVISFFQAREMFEGDSMGQVKLGREMKILMQHYDGRIHLLDENLARRADVIICCHPERLPPQFLHKHAFPNMSGEINPFPNRGILTGAPSGRGFTVIANSEPMQVVKRELGRWHGTNT